MRRVWDAVAEEELVLPQRATLGSLYRLLGTGVNGTVSLIEIRGADRGLDLLTVTHGDLDYRDYLRTEWNEYGGSVSPDGMRVAYVSDQSTQAEVYVRGSFPEPGERVPVSIEGGAEPVWAPDGNAIYFRSLDGSGLMKSLVRPEGGFSVPTRVLEDRWAMAVAASYGRNWDVHPEGGSFVFVTRPEGGDDATPIVPLELISNFFQLLRDLDPN